MAPLIAVACPSPGAGARAALLFTVAACALAERSGRIDAAGRVAASAAVPAVKIMPLGDSITFGCGSSCGCPASGVGCIGGCGFPITHFCATCAGGYRLYLEQMLNDSKAFGPFAFVGSQTSGPPGMMFTAHEGIPGISIAGQAKRIAPLVAQYAPDIVLLHLGTNGITAGSQALAADMANLLNVVYTAKADVSVLLSTLIHEVDMPAGNYTQSFNRVLPDVIRAQAAKGRRISLVDMWNKTKICVAGDPGCCAPNVNGTWGKHPTNEGYEKMAAVWADALLLLLSSF